MAGMKGRSGGARPGAGRKPAGLRVGPPTQQACALELAMLNALYTDGVRRGKVAALVRYHRLSLRALRREG